MAELDLVGITKRFADGTVAVKSIDLHVDDGEFVVLVGPSGCGKTTCLRMVAGLERISEGELLVDGRRVNHLTPRERDMAMIFQNYALYPHMTVSENMGFALKIARFDKPTIGERVDHAAGRLGLGRFLGRKPRELSGGQRQRVAMGRAIVREPKAFLMDEPLSNLDAKLRVMMRMEVARLQEALGTTTLYVTHDQVEAMTLGDRVAVLRHGVLQQYDKPGALYDDPANLFVGSFIGSPAMNICLAAVERDDGRLIVRFGASSFPVSDALLARYPRLVERVGRDVALGLRPEALYRPSAADRLIGTVERVEMLGSEALVYVTTDARPYTGTIADDAAEADMDPVTDDAGVVTMVVKMDPKARPADKVAVEVPFAGDEAHFFDVDTGEALR